MIAMYQEAADTGKVRCTLCPRCCLIEEGKNGFCQVRQNRNGVLYALTWSKPVSIAVDPIEKKPFSGFLPGSKAFSMGTFGCNLNCNFCQNHELSRGCYGKDVDVAELSPELVPTLAEKYDCRSVAYTYNEPGVFFEYVLETAREVRKAGLKNLLVTNGWLNPEAAEALYPLMDAINFDMKGFSEDFYLRQCGGSLAPVLENILRYHRMGGHGEYTNLVIPGLNDSPEMVDGWLRWAWDNLGKEAWLHFSAYFPSWHCRIPATPAETLFRIRDRALAVGFQHVILGNLR